ncbi:nuclear transport factor 2 family protein [Amycolatopsis sp. NPDC051373]|uniref:nuclear transport factor 2 family protein n=1 Tax=Amycolatopsis sp. NPDC051373 TaxID=3155801 RepID=UPI00344BF910
MNAVDIAEAIQVVTRGFTTADEKDWDAYEALRAPVVMQDFGGVDNSGSSSLTAHDARVKAERTIGPVALTQHQLSSFVVDVEGDEATVRFYEEALHVHPALGADPAVNTWVVFGKGTQKLTRTGAGWKISHAALVPTHSTGNPTFLADVAAALSA